MTLADDVKALQLGLNPFRKLVLREYAVPTKPTPGLVNLYAKADGLLYSMDDAGTETVVTGGGGGGGVSDGDKGDIVVSGGGATWMFDTGVVTAAAKTVLDDATVSDMVDTLGGGAATGTGVLVRKTNAALTTPNIGTPSAGTLTSCTGLPIASGVSGLGANVATFLATPSSANLAAALTDEKGSGALAFGVAAVQDYVHIGGGSGLTPYYVANMATNAALGTGAPTANVLRAIPFIAPRRGGTLDTLAYEITASVAGNTRIGLYESTSESNIYPAALLNDSGNIANSNAFKTFALSRALTPGNLYYLAVVSDVASTVRAIGLTNCGSILGNAGSGGAVHVGLSVAHAFGALPNPFTAGAAYMTAVPVPALLYKFSA